MAVQRIRSSYVIWEFPTTGVCYIMVALGGGNHAKIDHFRNRQEAEWWIDRQIKRGELEKREAKLFNTPWLTPYFTPKEEVAHV